MNYQQTIDYLFTRLPMFSRIGAAAFKSDLTNTVRLCEFLGNPQLGFKSIHVAGTNGKGSVSHMLATILQLAGYKTGLYTSPHLKDFRERIKVSGHSETEAIEKLTMIDPDFVVDFTERLKPLIEEIEPSFFEITVAMAFDYFVQQGVEVAVVEVGLGGRLDSTNIITPELSIITNIGWDHMNMLGDSLEKIAFEKAGIIKQDVPVVIGESLPETLPVFTRISNEKNAQMTIANEIRRVADWHWEKNQLVVEVSEEHHTDRQKYHLDLPGIYQTKNLLTVLEACFQLKEKGWKIEHEVTHRALGQVRKLTGLHGRWEIIHHSPKIILDVAHNVDGIRQLLYQLELMEPHQLHMIIGLVKDKEVEKIMNLLPKNAEYYYTKAQIPRAMPEEELATIGAAAGLHGTTFSDVNQAVKSALSKAGRDDLILVCGSVFLVGEVNSLVPRSG